MGCTGNLEKLRHEDSNLVLKINLKNSVSKTVRLRVWGYSLGEYLYLLTYRRLMIKYKTYSISKRKDIANELKQRYTRI